MFNAKAFAQEFCLALIKVQSVQDDCLLRDVKWRPPDYGFLKINRDASYKHKCLFGAVSVVGCDHEVSLMEVRALLAFGT